MDDFNNTITKYTNIITTNLIRDYNKIEFDLLNDESYKKLDMDEQSVLIDMIKSSIDLIDKPVINTNITTNTTITTNKSTFGIGSGTNSISKPAYGFGSKPKFGIAYAQAQAAARLEHHDNSNNSNIYKTKYVPNSYNFNKNNILTTNQDPNSNSDFTSEGELLSSKEKAIILEQITELTYITRSTQFDFLRNIVLPEQRSKEWFDMRNNKITASDCGAVLGENKHEPQFNFVMKKVFGSTFETNLACYHGKKFENIVTLMYEYVNDVIVDEFGLLGHPEHKFLGASPDGICGPFRRDKVTPSPLVGRMLEIKCPLMRKIKYSGDIKGEICPDYYWCQVQLQLECCDLEECDFVQCNIEEYGSRQDFLLDTNDTCEFKTKKYGLERGVVIELVPNKLTDTDYDLNGKVSNETIYDKTSFLYQPKLDMSLKELDNWILTEINKLESKNVRLHRVIYWRFIERNCTLIKRDKPWFAKHLEKMRTIWSYVEFLRTHSTVASEWKLWLDEQPRKMNDKVLNKLVELINKVSAIPFKNLNLLDQIVIDTTPTTKTPITKLDKLNNLIQTAELKQIDKLVIHELENLVIKEKEKNNDINSQVVDVTCEIPIIIKNKPKKEKIKEPKEKKEKKPKEQVELVQVVKSTKSSKYKKISIPINLDTDSD
jgi:putative phage-type endonuclease